jgi:hypothetical protein
MPSSASATGLLSGSARLCLAALLATCLPCLPVRADDQSIEYRIEAVYLYKIGDFVEWPESAFSSPSSAMNICVAGKDPFGSMLDTVVRDERIAGRPVVVRHLARVVRESGCQILYVGGSASQSIPQALETVRGTSVLTVIDTDQPDAGAIVRFITVEDHVRFSINLQAASLSGLVISSKLLTLATTVRAER